jgi:hypothetical protein
MRLELWEEYKSIIKEIEPYQKWAKSQNKRFRKWAFDKGPNPNTAPYTKKRPTNPKSGLGPLEEELAGVEIHDHLDPTFWSDDKLDAPVRQKLLQIAREFYKKLDLPAPILDITLTGSEANYNYSAGSDLDLHIVIDYTKVDDNSKLVKDFLTMAKTNWNRNHEILLKKHEVEIYVQDVNEPHHSTGVYSLLNDAWIIEPVKKEFDVSDQAIEQKARAIENLIEMVLELKIAKKYEEAYGEADRLMEKIVRYRQCGLEEGGEFSIENLVFKTLRHNEYLKKLSDLKKETYDKLMSLTENVAGER